MKGPPVQFSLLIGKRREGICPVAQQVEKGQGWEGGEDSVSLEQHKACMMSGPLSNHLVVCAGLVSTS